MTRLISPLNSRIRKIVILGVKKEEQKTEQKSSNGKTVKDLMGLVEKNWGIEAPKQAKIALMAAGFPKFEAEKWGEMLAAL